MPETLWAYGVVTGPWSPPEPVAGVEDRPVDGISHAGVTVLVSSVPADAFSAEALARRLEDLATLASLARAHDHVLQVALETTDVVPFSICALYRSRDAVEQMVREQSDHFAATLARLQNMTEWGVKAFIDAAAAEPVLKPTSGAEYIRRRRAQRDDAEAALTAAETAAAELHALLGEHAAASSLVARQDRRLTGRTAEMVLNGAYLVGRAEAEDFVRLVDEQGHDRLELDLIGPLPPYHFVQ